MIKLREIRKKLEKCWCRETVWHKPMWNPDHPSKGQCYVTAILIQNILGGKLVAGIVGCDQHYWNKLPDGIEVDLTSDQFDGGDGIHPHPRSTIVYSKAITNSNRRCKRYLILKEKYLEETNRY